MTTTTDERRARPTAALAWTTQTARADEIAAAVGGTGRRFTGRLPARPATAPLRYLINAVETVLWLARHRPGAVIVQNPPIVLPVIAYLWCAATRTPLVLDSHPVSFGRKGSRLWALFLPIHRWIAKRSALVLVTVDELADEAASWGSRVALLHEAPPEPAAEGAAGAADEVAPDRDRILFVGVFAADEPVAALVQAARSVPELEVHITGDPAKAPEALVAGAPPNVRFTGFLGPRDYAEALRRAGTVMTLTTESTSVVRAGYEAVYAHRPLIVSDWPTLREVFPHAVHTGHDPEALAAAMRAAHARHTELLAVAGQAAEEQTARWDAQLATLRGAIAAARRGSA